MLKHLKNAYNRYLQNFSSSVLHLINFHIFFFILFILIKTILILIGRTEWYDFILQNLVIPPAWSIFINRPWVIFTYFLVNTNLSYLFYTMLLLYNFGNILCHFLGVRKLFSLYISSTIASAIFFITLTFLRGIGSSLAGCLAGVYSILFACITFAPNYPLRLFFLGTIKLKYISIFFILFSLSKLTNGRIGSGSVELFGAFWGYLYIKSLSNGVDLGKPFLYLFDLIKNIFKSKKKSSNDIYISYKRANKKK